jgi:hypothetical protein
MNQIFNLLINAFDNQKFLNHLPELPVHTNFTLDNFNAYKENNKSDNQKFVKVNFLEPNDLFA